MALAPHSELVEAAVVALWSFSKTFGNEKDDRQKYITCLNVVSVRG